MARGNSPIGASQINYARVLQVLREEGGASRIELTRRTGLSPATLTGITRDLIKKGYIKTGETQHANGRGRPSELLIYDAESRYALGIELHNHTVYGAVTDLYARPIHFHQIASIGDDPEAVLTGIDQWMNAIKPLLGEKECAAIGVAVPGIVDQTNGSVVSSTEFNLTGVPIASLIAERIGHPVTIINRTYAAALAEVWLGIAKDTRNIFYVRMGEYIGGAILIDGLPYLGSKTTGVASIAHITVNPEGLPCRCGSRGCLDTVASGNAIVRDARARIKSNHDSSLVERTNGYINLITSMMIVEEAQQGDKVAQDVLKTAAHWMGIAMAITINLIGPDMIVFGGELGRSLGEPFVTQVSEEASKYMYSVLTGAVQIMPSILGPEAIACGAAATALWANLTQSISLHLG